MVRMLIGLLLMSACGCGAAQLRYTAPMQLDLCNAERKEWVLGGGADAEAAARLAQDLLPFNALGVRANPPTPNPCE